MSSTLPGDGVRAHANANSGTPSGTTGVHIAFAARSRDEVDAFHRAAIEHGATDIGKPGIRSEYTDGYYGAFVLDLDGNNVEAVFHEPTS